MKRALVAAGFAVVGGLAYLSGYAAPCLAGLGGHVYAVTGWRPYRPTPETEPDPIG